MLSRPDHFCSSRTGSRSSRCAPQGPAQGSQLPIALNLELHRPAPGFSGAPMSRPRGSSTNGDCDNRIFLSPPDPPRPPIPSTCSSTSSRLLGSGTSTGVDLGLSHAARPARHLTTTALLSSAGVRAGTRRVHRLGGRRVYRGGAPGAGAHDDGLAVDPGPSRRFALRLHAEYGGLPLLFTENGAAYDTAPDDGRVHDIGGSLFSTPSPRARRRARRPACPSRVLRLVAPRQLRVGRGLSKRFGIVWVDYESLAPIPKASAAGTRGVIGRNGLAGARRADGRPGGCGRARCGRRRPRSRRSATWRASPGRPCRG